MGRIDFGGVIKEASLAYLPEAQVGDYVIVHVGFAISRVDEEEAKQVFEYLREMEELVELEDSQPSANPPEASGLSEGAELSRSRVPLRSPLPAASPGEVQ